MHYTKLPLIFLSTFVAQLSFKVCKGTAVSPRRIYNSPEKNEIKTRPKENAETLSIEDKSSKTENKTYGKKIVNMTTVLAYLKEKNFLPEEQFYNLKGIAVGNADLLKRIIYKSKGIPLTRKFSSALRTFAVTLHYYSPRAYFYVRDTSDSFLPHLRTLKKWYCCVDGEPGFNKEALAFIKERIKNSNHMLLGTLMLNEMAIKHHIEYDGKKFSGYCDVGNNIASKKCNIAKEVLVFLVVGINELWKIPVGYFCLMA